MTPSSSSPRIDNEELRSIGIQLQELHCGGFVESSDQTVTLFYVQAPPSPVLAVLRSGTVLPQCSSILRALCELSNAGSGIKASWNCKKKDHGRLHARCVYGGCAPRSRSTGIRDRSSKKIGCPAAVSTILLSRFSGDVARREMARQVELAAVSLLKCESEGVPMQFCSVKTVNMEHVGHSPDLVSHDQMPMTRSSEVLSHPQLNSALRLFLRISPRVRGSTMKACKYLSELFPDISIPHGTIRNAIYRMSNDEEDASVLVSFLKKERAEGELEYLHVVLDDESGVLQSVTWSFSGSRDVVRRCGDLLFWDSTHNATRYAFKLATFTVIDSEGCSRAVLMTLNLEETAEACKRMLVSWHNAFDERLPHVVITDGDEGMYAALASVPYFEDITHLVCIFHLFDMNVKRRVQPLLTSSSGASSWASFRKSLAVCRQAGSEEELKRLWSQLLDEWLSDTSSHRAARSYLQKYVWSKRKQWATAYFQDSFTLGASTTQRSESWNSLIKCFSDDKSLTELVTSIRTLFLRQGASERKGQSTKWRTDPLRTSPSVVGSHIMQLIGKKGLSRFACVELAKEMSAAERMIIDGSLDGALGTNTHVAKEEHQNANGEEHFEMQQTRSGLARYLYGKGVEKESSTAVAVTFPRIAISSSGSGSTAGSSPSSGNSQLTCATNVMRCDCLYPSRTRLPCRHGLAFCMHIDRSEDDSILPALLENGYNSALEYLFLQATHPRWVCPFSDSSNNQELRLLPTVRPERNVGLQESRRMEGHSYQLEGDIEEWIATSGKPTNSLHRFSGFPTDIKEGGGVSRTQSLWEALGHFRS